MTSVSGVVEAVRRSGFLRPEPSRFLGRSAELESLREPLMRSRLVTIVGPAGIGKTRLALRYATTRRDDYRSVWFCDLREARDVGEMIATALRTFAVRDRAAPQPADAATAVARALGARGGALVVLDNLEHLLPEAAPVVRRWVANARDVSFVVTSRVPMLITGEQVIELGAMPLPPASGATGDAVDLFVDRVRSRCADYLPRDDELRTIGEIVCHLRGVPLAIELAAARVGAEDPSELLSRVSPRSNPPASAEASPGSTRRAIDRAFALLAPSERDALCQCSVFRGSFSLHAAERVVQLGGRATESVSDVVVGLARKHLLQVERHQPLRFAMCEAIRQHASEALAASPDASGVEWRHADHFFHRAVQIADEATRPADALDERDDLQAAMALGVSAQRPQIVLRVAIALDALVNGGGLDSTQLAHLDEALRLGAAGDLGLLGRALGVRAGTLYALGRLDEARRDAETALRLASEIGDRRQAGAMLRWAGESSFQLGDFDSARDSLERALEVERERGEAGAVAAVHVHLGSLHQSLGEAERAHHEFESALALAASAGDHAIEARAHMGLAWYRFERGERDEALRTWERALVLVRRMRMTRAERIVVGYMGVAHFDAGDLDAAEAHLRRAAFASQRAGDLRVEGIFEGVRGGVLAALDRVEEARSSLDLAGELLRSNAFYARAISVYRGHLDLAEARAAEARGDGDGAREYRARAARRIDDARAATAESASLVRRSDDARMGVRILERAIGGVDGLAD